MSREDPHTHTRPTTTAAWRVTDQTNLESGGTSMALAVLAGGAVIAGGLALAALTRYRVGSPTQYIVRTGLGINDISIAKKAFQWPFQRMSVLELTPHTYTFVLSAMSHEKLSFHLPVNFTVGPKDDQEMLVKYARFVSSQDATELSNLVKGVIEGEARVLAASMAVEDIFKDRVTFKERIVDGVDSELRKFGLTVWNANIKDLQDTEGSEYFLYLRQKAVEGAVNQAKIDVSEARMKGDIGEKTRVGTTRQEVARIEAETVEIENRRRAEITQSASSLRIKTAEAEQHARLAEIQSKQAAALREAELDASLNQRLVTAEVERLRASQLAAAQVEAEAAIKRAQGVAEASMKDADAALYRARADAEGTRAKYDALASGMERLRGAIGGDSGALLSYVMIDRGVYTELAARNAEAVKGLSPKITVWHTGSDAPGGAGAAAGAPGAGGPFKSIADLYRMLPPLASTVAEQTGIKPPSWLMTMPEVPAASSEGGASSATVPGSKPGPQELK